MTNSSCENGGLNKSSNSKSISIDLLEILIREKIISQAQAQVVQADHEATGMTPGEVLLARRWISEEKLSELLPASNFQPCAPDTASDATDSEYDKNLKEYRRLMSEILGESS